MYSFIKKLPLVLLISFLQIGCQESRDPQTPEGALRLFGVALEQGDQALIKASLSEKTSQQLQSMISTLKKIDREIKQFPGQEAQRWARQEALGEELAKIEIIADESSLWQKLVGPQLDWAKTQTPGTVEQGVNFRRILTGSIEGGEMTMLTRSDNQVSLRKEGVRWVITSFEKPLDEFHNALKGSLKHLKPNRKEWIRRQKLNLNLPKFSPLKK
jgi:hypothetical protein